MAKVAKVAGVTIIVVAPAIALTDAVNKVNKDIAEHRRGDEGKKVSCELTDLLKRLWVARNVTTSDAWCEMVRKTSTLKPPKAGLYLPPPVAFKRDLDAGFAPVASVVRNYEHACVFALPLTSWDGTAKFIVDCAKETENFHLLNSMRDELRDALPPETELPEREVRVNDHVMQLLLQLKRNLEKCSSTASGPRAVLLCVQPCALWTYIKGYDDCVITLPGGHVERKDCVAAGLEDETCITEENKQKVRELAAKRELKEETRVVADAFAADLLHTSWYDGSGRLQESSAFLLNVVETLQLDLPIPTAGLGTPS